MDASKVTQSATVTKEIVSHEDVISTHSESVEPTPTGARRVNRKVGRSRENLQEPPIHSNEAAVASGSGACSVQVHVDGNDGWEPEIEKFVRHMRQESAKEKALAKNKGDKKVADRNNAKEVPRRRRKRRVSFKPLGSVGRPFYRAEVPENREPFRCYQCPAQFTFLYELEMHTREHSGARLLPCYLCPMEYPTGRMLANHMARKHGGRQR